MGIEVSTSQCCWCYSVRENRQSLSHGACHFVHSRQEATVKTQTNYDRQWRHLTNQAKVGGVEMTCPRSPREKPAESGLELRSVNQGSFAPVILPVVLHLEETWKGDRMSL